MTTFRLALAAFCTLVALLLITINLFQAHWLSAISILFLGIGTVGLSLFFSLEFERPLILDAFFSLSTILGVAGIFFEHRAFDISSTELHQKALIAIASAEFECPAAYQIANVLNEGLKSCAIQNNSDISDAVFQLGKAVHLPDSVGLIDATHSTLTDPDVDRCVYYAKQVYAVCPNSFFGLSSESKAILLK